MTVILIFTSSLLGAWLTYLLSHHAKFTPVRASSLLTLLFYCVLYLLGVAPDMWAAAFFGGSFVGMSAPHRFGMMAVTVAGSLFAACYEVLLPFIAGVGGALGVSAFLSVAAVHLLTRLLAKMKAKESPSQSTH